MTRSFYICYQTLQHGRFEDVNCYVNLTLPNDPEWPAGTRTSAGFVQNDGQVPRFLTAAVAGGISYKDFFVLDAPQHDKMSRLREMPLGHQSHD